MSRLRRRDFLAAPALAAAAGVHAAGGSTRVGLVRSSNRTLANPASPEASLDYEQIREMVWKAIEYGRPRTGRLEDKIKPGDWLVIKPNICFLRPQGGYRTGDITDMRVTKAVLEYVAGNSRAARITIAEGGSYRGVHDPSPDAVVRQNGARVAATGYNWGNEEFPGWGGTIQEMLEEFGARFPGKKFDYIDLSYDAARDASGAFRRIECPRSPNGTGAFGERSDYCITNTILECDFLITVPVMKVHSGSGITCCLKNYVGVAPREAYAGPRGFANSGLHEYHSLEGRIDSFICDLAAFHPPDYCVVDGIRGLQHTVHNNRRPDQMIRSNLVLAGEDPVATDAVVAKIMGFNPQDLEYLHMAARREMGTMDFGRIEVAGEEPDRLMRRWGKPSNWHGRANREWRVSADPAGDPTHWTHYTANTDTLHLDRCLAGGVASGGTCGAAVRVRAGGHRKAFLWVGVQGRVTVSLNGEQVMEEQSRTSYRVGQFQQPVELRSGENLLVFRVEAFTAQADLSALLVGPRNDGDTVEGISWVA